MQNCNRLAILLFFFTICAYGSSVEPILISVCPEKDDIQSYTEKIVRVLPEQLEIERITYESDVCFQQAEFDYLVDIKQGTKISRDGLIKAVFYCTKKQKFETILITAQSNNHGAYSLHFKFVSFWTFRKLKIKGIYVGKDQFRQLYLMEHGEQFDERRHEDSIKKITDLLHRDGYFDAHLGVELLHDQQTKSVVVQINLHKGQRYFVDEVVAQVDSKILTHEETAGLQELIAESFCKRLAKNYYSRELINAETQELQTVLIRHGYLHVELNLEENIKHAGKQVTLQFFVHISYKKNFSFEGNRFFSRQELQDAILVFGRSTSLLPASILSEEIIKCYHRKGFWHADVQAQEHASSNHFIITEGPRAFVQSIELRNLNSFNQKDLVKKFFQHTVRNRYYDALEIESACSQLLAYLVHQGFWQAEILREYFEPLGEDAYKMVLIFDEGKRCFLQEVTFDGFSHWQKSCPFGLAGQSKQPIPFDVSIIDRQREWLNRQLEKEGHFNASIKPECRNEDGNIYLKWLIDIKKAQEKFDKTILVGSSTFPFANITRELDYRIGDAWHPETLRHSVSRLKKMEVFESISLTPDKDPDIHEKVMILKLQKDDPYEIKTRLGLGAQHVTKSLTTGGPTYRVGGSFIYKNPFNAGDQFRADADFTRAIRLVNALYRRPWIFGMPVTAEFKAYTNRFEYPGFIGSQKNLYTVIQQGFLANFTGAYSHVDAAVSTGIEVVDTFIDESTVDDVVFAQKVAKAISFRPDLLDKNIPFFQLQSTAMLYFLDNTINPTRGSFSVLSAKGMFPLAKLSPRNYFIRILAEQSFFLPLMPFVIALRCRVGHIFHPQLCTIIPIERFYLGGANSIRSYETDQCPPLGVVQDVDGQDLYVPQGGRSLVNASLELRFPLYNKLGGVVFGDIGALSSNKLTEIRACDMLSGLGFGLRYNTPIGPLRFDFAWRGNKRDGVGRPYAWFLSFGNAFI